jgi:rhodanese-related sulfurtransferase
MSFGAGVPTVGIDDLKDGDFLLDVREDDEWHVLCRVGGRSAQVTMYLVQQGVDAVNVDGGMQEWAAAGRPVVDDKGEPGHVL